MALFPSQKTAPSCVWHNTHPLHHRQHGTNGVILLFVTVTSHLLFFADPLYHLHLPFQAADAVWRHIRHHRLQLLSDFRFVGSEVVSLRRSRGGLRWRHKAFNVNYSCKTTKQTFSNLTRFSHSFGYLLNVLETSQRCLGRISFQINLKDAGRDNF